MLLAPVMRMNEPFCRERLAAVYDRVFPPAEKTMEEQEKSEAVIQKLEDLSRHLQIPASLAGYGITLEDVDGLVKAGMEVKRLLNNNPKEITEEDARNIYLGLLKG